MAQYQVKQTPTIEAFVLPVATEVRLSGSTPDQGSTSAGLEGDYLVILPALHVVAKSDFENTYAPVASPPGA